MTTGAMDRNLYQYSAEKIIQEFAAAGLLEDVSGQVGDYSDYSILEEVTGESPADLGRSWFRARVALRAIRGRPLQRDLAHRRDAFITVLGPSGCGKSTSLASSSCPRIRAGFSR